MQNGLQLGGEGAPSLGLQPRACIAHLHPTPPPSSASSLQQYELRSASPAELALKVSRRHLVGSAGLVCSSWHAAGASRAWDRASFDAGACAAHLAGHPIKGRDDHGRSASGNGAVTLRWAPGRRQVRTEARDCGLWVDSCPRTAARVCAARAPPPTLAPPASTGCSRGWCCLASVCA